MGRYCQANNGMGLAIRRGVRARIGFGAAGFCWRPRLPGADAGVGGAHGCLGHGVAISGGVNHPLDTHIIT